MAIPGAIARAMTRILLSLLTMAAVVSGQLPVTATGSWRIMRLDGPSVGAFTPEPGAPSGAVALYGHLPQIPIAAPFPSPPTGYEEIGGFTGRLSGRDGGVFLFSRRTFFHVLGDSGFVPAAEPQTFTRVLQGIWVVFDGSHLSPVGSLRGSFEIRIATFPGPTPTAGRAEGDYTILSATGTLARPGLLGAEHRLFPPTNSSPNWLAGPGDAELLYLSSRPADRFGPAEQAALAPGSTRPVAADVNADAATDVAVLDRGTASLHFSINDGQGSLLPGGQLALGGAPHLIASGDLNGDGRLDLVVAEEAPFGLRTYLALPGGGHAAGGFVPLPERPSALALEDLNFDGGAEIAVAGAGLGFGPGLLRVLVNDGAGGVAWSLDLGPAATRPLALVLDRGLYPGQAQLMVADGGNPALGVSPRFLAIADLLGLPSLVADLPLPSPPTAMDIAPVPGALRAVAVSTLGDPLLAAPGQILVIEEAAIGAFAAPQVIATGGPYADARIFDQDRDGRLEIIASAFDQPDLELWTRDGGAWATEPPLSLPAPASDLLRSDLNRDGFPDLVAVSPVDGSLSSRLSVPAAQAEAIGRGCPGSFGISPVIAAGRLPQQQNPIFTIQLRNALPNSAALLFLSQAPANIPLPGLPEGCGIYTSFLDRDLLIVPLPAVTDGQGFAQFFFSIPDFAPAQGFNVWAQWAVIDPAGSLATVPPFAITGGLRLTLF